MIESDIKQLIVLDSIKDTLEMTASDIIPESETHPVVTGIENVPSAIRSVDGQNTQSAYTTFPLSPLEGRVHYIKDSFLFFSIDVQFGIAVGQNIDQPLAIYVGPRDTASIFDQIQLMIDGSAIYTTTYQQLESAIDFAGLPASVVDHSNNYATVDKLLHFKDTPMKLCIIPAGTYGQNVSGSTITFSHTYEFSIDLNRLCVPLSNIKFITSNMGNLRLRVYLSRFSNSFYYCQVPSSFIKGGVVNVGYTFNSFVDFNGLVSMNPVQWGTSSVSADNKKLTFSNPVFVSNSAKLVDVTASGQTGSSTYGTVSGNTGMLDNQLENNLKTFIPIQFIRHPTANSCFMHVTRADICQTCFDIDRNSWDRLDEYFAATGAVILPIQAWATNVCNNGTLSEIGAVPSTLLANVPGNNITAIVVTFTPQNAQSCLLNPYISSIQGILDGKPLNSIPYDYINNRAIQDITNACVDTDCEEINTDLLYSLAFPPKYPTTESGMTQDGTSNYFFKYGTLTDFQMFGRWKAKFGDASNYIKNPNLFMLVFQTAVPDSFHTGMCIYDNSTGRQALFRLTSSGLNFNDSTITSRFKAISSTQITQDASGSTGFTAQDYPTMITVSNVPSQANISCLCDMCIVLTFDSSLHTCVGGSLSPVKPYLVE